MRKLFLILFLICLATSARAQFTPSAANTSLSNLNFAPTTNGDWMIMFPVTANAKVKPVSALIGTATDSITGSTTTYTVTYAQNATRTTHDYAATGTVTVTLPTATTLGNPNFTWSYCNNSPQSDSIVPTTWTIQADNNVAGSSLSVASGKCYSFTIDANSSTQWHANGNSSSSGGGTTVAATTCAMSSATTCTASLSSSVTSPIAVCSDQTGVIACGASVSGTTVTVTAASSNSHTFNVMVVPAAGFSGGGGGGSTYTYVGTGKNSGTLGPVNVTYSPTAGHMLIVDLFTGAGNTLTGNTLSVTDNIGDIFTSAVLDRTTVAAAQPFGEYYLYSVSSGVTTITLNSTGGSGTNPSVNIIVREYTCSGACTGPDQISAVGSGTGTTLTAGTINPTVANSLVSTFFWQNVSQAVSSSSPFTARSDIGDGSNGLGVLDDIVTTTASIAGKALVSGTATYHGYTVNYK